MPELIVVLFAVLSAPDGTKQASNVAQVATTDICQVIAAELNQSPRKPAEVSFGCRVVRAPVEIKS